MNFCTGLLAGLAISLTCAALILDSAPMLGGAALAGFAALLLDPEKI